MHAKEVMKKHFSYNPNTGEIARLTRRNSGGSLDKDGYLIIKFRKKQIKAHRLAWLLYYGDWPTANIDHINRNRRDNRIANLRDVPQSVNVSNTARKPNKDTGHVGIYYDKCTKGLLSKYTTKIAGHTRRFRTLQEAINTKAIYETC